jgi:hypothetical protein
VAADARQRSTVTDKPRFLCAYDYGMGGVWGYVLAPSADAIRERFPELTVFTEAPEWFTDESRDGLGVEDLDEPRRLGLLGVTLESRNPLGRENVDRLLAWHRETFGLELAQTDVVDERGVGDGRTRIRISLAGTGREDASFAPVTVERDEDDWFHARVEDGVWVADCGVLSTNEVYGVFLDWVTGQ